MDDLITEYLTLAYPIKRIRENNNSLGLRLPTNGLKSSRKFKKVIIINDEIILKISSDDKNMMVNILVDRLVKIFNIDREYAKTFILKHLRIN